METKRKGGSTTTKNNNSDDDDSIIFVGEEVGVSSRKRVGNFGSPQPIPKKRKAEKIITPIKQNLTTTTTTRNLTFGKEKHSKTDSASTSSTGRNFVVAKDKLFDLRPVVIDGSNVAVCYGKQRVFDARGIMLCVEYFIQRGHRVTVFVPQIREEKNFQSRGRLPTVNGHFLTWLAQNGLLTFTPHRRIERDAEGRRCNRTIVCYDDLLIVEYANTTGGVIISRDNFRDVVDNHEEWASTVYNRLLMFTWVGDTFMISHDPLGRRGSTADRILRYDDQETNQHKGRSFYKPEDASVLLHCIAELLGTGGPAEGDHSHESTSTAPGPSTESSLPRVANGNVKSLEMATHHGGRRDAPQVRMIFHEVCGLDAGLNADRTIVSRLYAGTGHAIAFTDRPIRPYEKLVIQVLQIDRKSMNACGISFGMTTCDPTELKNFFPNDPDELGERSEFWALTKNVFDGDRVAKGDLLAFAMDSEGNIYKALNKSPWEFFMCVDKSLIYYMYFDICGNTQSVQIVGLTAIQPETLPLPFPAIHQ